MPPKPKRMNREEFFAKLSPMDAEQLRKALWNLYWRGSAPLRERIENELDPAEDAMELMIDLACEASRGGYFRSEDPLVAARFVVSHAAAALWQTMLDQHGFGAFAERAAPQLIRWESRYGWTQGYGKVSGHETSLAEVLEPKMTTPDMWA